jgi:hypothetical protein
MGQGAYVDMGYGFNWFAPTPVLLPLPASSGANAYSLAESWFFRPRALSDVYLDSRPLAQQVSSQLAPGYAVYDTWSFHYENDGANQDLRRHDGNNAWDPVFDNNGGVAVVDEGTNGMEDYGAYVDNPKDRRLGVDDAGERETMPPYDKPLRGVQVVLRIYEPDARSIRQVRVNQHFMPE